MIGRLAGLLAIGGALIVVMAWEVHDAPRNQVMTPESRVGMAPFAAPVAPAEHLRHWAADVVARPLFSPDRRPAADSPVARSGPSGLPRLSGILVGPFGRSAIFASRDSKAIVLHEGGRIDTYTVKSIDAAAVQVLGPSGPQVLQPAFSMAGDAGDGSKQPTHHIGQAAVPR